ncbi:MAG: SGNH/GDSL hydrolase family protein [Chitinophagaceae bacterium]|jgi:hypothetical protein|nr:SGNH/GDSL hydrolase family protein [Chitinophagaceae bacterium]
MTLKTIVAILILHLLPLWVSAQQNGTPADFAIRNGLPNFFTKAMKGDAVKVAYLGGSITAQEGWRVYSLQWLQETFPQASFSQVHAAIGGTGSDFGVFRLQEHVLQYKPDLVFVEFAVNDGNTPSDRIIRSMEGIVRQIFKANPYTDVCFVYTIKADYLETEQKGQLPNSAINMEKVASYYGIPTINFGSTVANMVSTNQLIMSGGQQEVNGIRVFSPDGVHPYPATGHKIYHSVLVHAFQAMKPASAPTLQQHKLPKPLAPDYYAQTQMVDISQVQRSANWELLNLKEKSPFSGFGNYLRYLGKASQSGETITLRFKGRAFGAYDVMGPDAGRVIVEIDGQVTDTLYRFDAYCTYRRMNYFVIDGLKNRKHTVVFKTLCEPFDKAAILAKRNQTIKTPEDYQPNNWYVGKLLIDGKLLQ